VDPATPGPVAAGMPRQGKVTGEAHPTELEQDAQMAGLPGGEAMRERQRGGWRAPPPKLVVDAGRKSRVPGLEAVPSYVSSPCPEGTWPWSQRKEEELPVSQQGMAFGRFSQGRLKQQWQLALAPSRSGPLHPCLGCERPELHCLSCLLLPPSSS